MNRTAHQAAGIAASLTATFGEDRPVNPSEFLLLVVSGELGSRLPDLIEPASNPRHRRIFHSLALGLLLAYGVRRIWRWSPGTNLERAVKWIALGISLGYASHLFLDSTTPNSLPLVGVT